MTIAVTQFDTEAYFEWLYNKAFDTDMYVNMAYELFETPFEWSVDFDGNRAADGISLRREFLFECGESREHYDWDDSSCSFLEMMVALASKLSMLLDKSLPSSVANMMRNTSLSTVTNSRYYTGCAESIAEDIMSRNYSYDGEGGFFPLNNATTDQRNVELLTQLNQYVVENGW